MANCKTTGVFEPSHRRGLLYDAIHGWMTGRMDGKFHEKWMTGWMDVFDDTFYKITTTNYISKTSLYTTLLGSFWGNLFSLFQPEIYFFYTF